ncbi:MAG: hypothetical protein AAB268_13235 [Elusimicrobiota bacterium]
MKILRRLSVVAVVLAAACATMPPVQFEPQTPNLAVASKRNLKLAVVVSDPMPYDVFYSGQACPKTPNRCYKRDMTAELRSGGFPLESALSRVVSETLSQAFSQVVVVRDLPQPGQYDGVVTLGIGRILNQERVVLTGETNDITAEWTMSVLDKQNKEILNTKGVSPMHNYPWSAFNPRPTFVKGISTKLSLILSELSKEWGATLYALDFNKS